MSPDQTEFDPEHEKLATKAEQDPTTVDSIAWFDGTIRKLPPSGERFVPIRAHARGGLGEVFEARDVELGRKVALKVIQDRYSGDPKNRSRFVREAEITGNLEHPGIVPVYGFGRSADGCPFYAMKFIQGKSFETEINEFHAADNVKRCPNARSSALRKLISRLKDACLAIEYAHTRGVLHRDIKPANIMLGKHGETLVVDWGLAKKIGAEEEAGSAFEGPTRVLPPTESDQTMPGSRVGTPAFMSPEQASGKLDELGPVSDVYNLGATLYNLLTGRPPFEREPPSILLVKVQRGDFPPPREVSRRPIPPALEAICLKAMARRPEDRYPTAEALARDLECWLVDDSVSAYPEPFTGRVARWARRHRGFVLGGVGVVLSLVLVLGFTTVIVHTAWRGEQESRIKSQKLASELEMDQGLYLCDQGSTGRGMLRLAHALLIAPEDQADLRGSILKSLSAWSAPLARLHDVLDRSGSVKVIAIGRQGAVLASGGEAPGEDVRNGEARLWDLTTSQPIGPPLPHPRRVVSIALHPDGKRLLTGSEDRNARFWDATTGKELALAIEHAGPVRVVAIAPDGKSFLTGAGRTIQIWDSETFKPLPLPDSFAKQPADIRAAVYSPDGTKLAVAGADDSAQLWNVDSKTKFGKEMLHQSTVSCLAFNPDGTLIASGTENGMVRLWKTETQDRLLPRGIHQSEVYSVAFSPDGKTLFSGSEDNTARLWDVETGRPVGVAVEHLSSVVAVGFGLDGRTLVTSCLDGATRLWESAGARPLRSNLEQPAELAAVAYHPAGSMIAVAAGASVRFFEPATLAMSGKPLETSAEVRSLAYSPDGHSIVTGCADGVAQVWDAEMRKASGYPLKLDGPVTAVAFRPDGKAILAGGDDVPARLWDPNARTALGPPLVNREGRPVFAFHPDGTSVAVADGDRINLWQLVEGVLTKPSAKVLRGHHGAVQSVSYSPDGRSIATGADDNTVRVWDAKSGSSIGIPLANDSAVMALAFSADGKMLAAGCRGSVRLWDVVLDRPLGPPLPHTGRVRSVAFSRDGKTLISACRDLFLRVWDMPAVLPDQAARTVLWVEGLTGIELQAHANSSGLLCTLEEDDWRHRCEQLHAIDGDAPHHHH